MREYTTPAVIEPPTTGGLSDPVWANASSHPDTAVFSRRVEGGGWLDISAAEFARQVSGVAKGLIAAGVKHGDRVALLSATRYEWTLIDYAIWSIGAATVPIYETSSASQVEWILTDSEAVVAVVENAAHGAVVESARAEAPALQEVWQIESGAVEELTVLGQDITDAELDKRRTAVVPGDLATLIYTSGTTGRPKGCKISHANFMDELGTATKVLPDLFRLDGASTLLFLPLAHVFARIIQVGCVLMRVKVGHTADVKNLVADLGEFKPTFILSVPRVFEKVFNTASQTAHASGKGKIFDAAAATAIEYSQAMDKGGAGFGLKARHALYDKLVYGKLRAVLGGQVDYAVSGGAPLGDRLGHFFRGIGVPVLEGYGLTETTAALAVNLPGDIRIGTVGKPLPGVTVGVDSDGELCFKGGQVMLGYWKNDEATAAAIDAHGWFHTGDLGEFDADGFIRITGRKKEILVTAAWQERRARSVGGPDPPAPAGQPVHGRRRRQTLHCRPGHHRPRDHRRLGHQTRQIHGHVGPGDRQGPDRRDPDRHRRREHHRLQGRSDQEVQHPRERLDPGERRALVETLAAPPHRDEKPRSGCRGAVRQVVRRTAPAARAPASPA